MYILGSSVSLLDKLELWDKWLFIKVNTGTANPIFDAIMPYVRNQHYWMPLYLFFLVFVLMNFKSRGIWWIVFFLCTVALTDITSSRPIKDAFERLRPCNDPEFLSNVRLMLKNCGGGFSFTSSHAANHFGMATFFFITLRFYFGKWALLAFVWAALVSFAQIYVGVHFPFDILGGALIGVLFGLFTGMIFNKIFGLVNFDKQYVS